MTENRGWVAMLGPGILIAATGVGAGDLATAAFTGSQLGTAVLWAVVLGAFLKWVLNEGIARWQLASDETLLEGAVARLGRPVAWLFLPYLLLWSFFVGAALMSACGVTMHAIAPVFDSAADGKIAFGIAHALLGAALVRAGGFALFEKIMGLCIGVMFAVVVVTAIALWPGHDEVVRGLFRPSIPDRDGQGLTWTVALMGGVGGTLTVLCYGYWIREKGRRGLDALRLCRLDLGVGYAMTAIFGMCMVIIGSAIAVHGKGAGLVVSLADRLDQTLGPAGKWAFLVGAWGAVFSSLLGVWQAVPYLFADFVRIVRKSGDADLDLTGTRSYRMYLLAITFVPMLGLGLGFKEVQKFYAIIGALFIPMLALALLILNSRRVWVGRAKNGPAAIAVLIATLLFFGWIAFGKATAFGASAGEQKPRSGQESQPIRSVEMTMSSNQRLSSATEPPFQ